MSPGSRRLLSIDPLNVNRDNASPDILRLKDESLSESENLPAPGLIGAEIVEALEAAPEQFREILADIVPLKEEFL